MTLKAANYDTMMNDKLYVLIACEESQAECTAFRELGHIAYSCDLQPVRGKRHPEWHIHGDVTPYLNGLTEVYTQAGTHEKVPRWDLIIAHPPCTFLCKLSSCILYKNPDTWAYIRGELTEVNGDRWRGMQNGREFFLKCLSARAPYVAVENPIPMAIANLPRANAFADPSWFGVKYTKKTLYWLRNLPPIMPRLYYPGAKCYVTASRGRYRSRTFPALARAIAEQWSEYILRDIRLSGRPKSEPVYMGVRLS